MKIYDYGGKGNIVGDRVRQARQKQQLTQAELAAKLQINDVNVDQQTISRIEKQERVVADYELLHLAKILKVNVLWLLGE